MLTEFIVILIILGSLIFRFTPDPAIGYTGFNATTLLNNTLPSITAGNTFPTMFAVLFPSVTGIMAGANMCTPLTVILFSCFF